MISKSTLRFVLWPSAVLLPLGLLLVVTGCKERPAKPEVVAEGPNVVLISMDTLRADRLSSYGHDRPTSLSIDGLAARGALFENASSTSAWTPPAHASVFAGRFPSDVGILKISGNNRANTLVESEVTLAEVMREAGYETQAWSGGGYLSEKIGFGQGFETYRDRHDLQDYLEEVLDWLGDSDRKKKPFFLFLHFYNSHRPYLPPGNFRTKFSGDYAGKYNMRRFCVDGKEPAAVDLEYVRSQYDGEIAHADALLGKLFRTIDKGPLGKDTLIVFLSDHGDEFYEHGRCDHSRTVFQEMVHVPLILAGPKIGKGRIPENVSLIDVPRTILDYVDIKAPASMRGRSLLPTIAGESKNLPVFFETQGFGEAPPTRGVRFETWKMVFENERSAIGLYDLSTDATEQKNLLGAPEFQQRQRQLTVFYDEWRTAIRAGVRPAQPGDKHETVVDPEVEERLRALGYIE